MVDNSVISPLALSIPRSATLQCSGSCVRFQSWGPVQSGNTGQPHTSGICHPGIPPMFCSPLESPVLLRDSGDVRVLPPQGHPIGRVWPGEQRWAQPCPCHFYPLRGVSPYPRVGSGSDTPFPFTLKAFTVLSIATFLVRK